MSLIVKDVHAEAQLPQQSVTLQLQRAGRLARGLYFHKAHFPIRQQGEPIGYPVKAWGHELKRQTAALLYRPRELLFYFSFSHAIRAWVVEVESEELYRAIMRPINTELRREARKKANHTAPASLNQMLEDIGFDVADENAIDPALRFQQKGLLAALSDYIATLSDEDRAIVIAILTKRRDREVMAELGITKQSTYSSRKMKVKRQLQKHMKNWL